MDLELLKVMGGAAVLSILFAFLIERKPRLFRKRRRRRTKARKDTLLIPPQEEASILIDWPHDQLDKETEAPFEPDLDHLDRHLLAPPVGGGL